MQQYELNFIWVGANPIPPLQEIGFHNTRIGNPEAVINLWVMPGVMHPSLRILKSRFNLNLVDIDTLLIDPNTSPKTYEIIQLLKQSTLYSGFGDILKFLILTRELSPGAPSKRFYMEADNHYPFNLAGFIKERGLVFHRCQMNGEVKFRADSFFLDLQAVIGLHIKKLARVYLEMLLADNLIYPALKGIIQENLDHGYNNELVVLDSFGEIPYTLLTAILRKADFCCFADFADDNFSNTGIHQARSWVDPRSVPKTTSINGLVAHMRFADFSAYPQISMFFMGDKNLPARDFFYHIDGMDNWVRDEEQEGTKRHWKISPRA